MSAQLISIYPFSNTRPIRHFQSHHLSATKCDTFVATTRYRLLQPLQNRVEEVSLSPLNRKPVWLAFYRILKDEYNRTRNRVIGKAQFPSLLKKLWKTNAVQKTNIVKSFMKAGVFPLNSNAIDRSRVLKNSDSTTSSLDTRSTISLVNSRNNSSTTINPKDSNTGGSTNTSAQIVISSTPTVNRVVPTFTSSRQAVSYLDRVIEEMMSGDDDDDSNISEHIDEASSDDDNIRYQSIRSPSSILKGKRSPSREAPPLRTNQRPSSPAKRRASNQQARKIIGFDTSDEEGARDGALIPLTLIVKYFLF